MEILRSEVVVVDVGVRPYSSKMPTTSNPVGPLSDTRIHVAPTLVFPSTVKPSISSSIFLGRWHFSHHSKTNPTFSSYYKQYTRLVTGVWCPFNLYKTIFFTFISLIQLIPLCPTAHIYSLPLHTHPSTLTHTHHLIISLFPSSVPI